MKTEANTNIKSLHGIPETNIMPCQLSLKNKTKRKQPKNKNKNKTNRNKNEIEAQLKKLAQGHPSPK